MAPRISIHKKKFSIIYKNQLIADDFEDFNQAFSFLYAFYFIFDLSYPSCFIQVLGYFHDICFQFEEIRFKKSENHVTLSKMLDSVFF